MMYGITMWPLLKDVRSSSKMKTHIYLIGKTTIHSLVTFLITRLSHYATAKDKTSTSALLTMPKLLTVWITTN